MADPKPSNSRLTGVLRLRVDTPFRARHFALVIFACGAMLLGALQLLRGVGADPNGRLEAKNDKRRAPTFANADAGVPPDDARKRPKPTPTWWDVQVDPDDVANTFCADPSNALKPACQEIQLRVGPNPALHDEEPKGNLP